MRLVIAMALLLAGCMGNQLPTASVTVEYPDGSTAAFQQMYDEDARPTSPLYQAEGIRHPAFYSVHDLVHDIGQGEGPIFTTQFFSFDGSGGFFVCSIRDRPPLDDGACPADATGFYEFRIDGQASDSGISDVEVEAGETYGFVWTPFSSP